MLFRLQRFSKGNFGFPDRYSFFLTEYVGGSTSADTAKFGYDSSGLTKNKDVCGLEMPLLKILVVQ